ncbi:NAD(P)H-hydrate epimerase [bacterium]|nr:MAG: NAD(P)H-hydrate epimerase [bacterium]
MEARSDIFVSVARMRALEEKAVKSGIAISALMESAGKHVADEVMKSAETVKPISVFCGYGNNGGDGMCAARHLIENGYAVKIFLAGKPKPFSPQARACYDKLVDLNHKPQTISAQDEIEKAFGNIGESQLIIDALFGIGIRGPLDDFYQKLITRINSSGVPVIAVDIPSGLDADSGRPLGAAIKAHKTITFGYPKAGFNNPEAKAYVGELVIADIGLPKSIQ